MKSKEILASLFSKGSHFVFPPFHIRYLNQEAEKPGIQATFSVPKKKYKRAVDRNLIKRRIKEAHRLNKHLLEQVLQEHVRQIHIIYIYSSKKILDYKTIEHGVLSFINHLSQEID